MQQYKDKQLKTTFIFREDCRAAKVIGEEIAVAKVQKSIVIDSYST